MVVLVCFSSFSNLVGMLKGPVAFQDLMLLISSSISLEVTKDR